MSRSDVKKCKISLTSVNTYLPRLTTVYLQRNTKFGITFLLVKTGGNEVSTNKLLTDFFKLKLVIFLTTLKTVNIKKKIVLLK